MKGRWLVLAITALFVGVAGAQGRGMGPDGGGGMMGPGGGQGMMQGQPGQGQGIMQQSRFRNVDIDGDGFITQQELQAHEQLMQRLQQNWQQADQNGDGQVSQAEFAAFEQRTQQQMQQGQPPSQ